MSIQTLQTAGTGKGRTGMRRQVMGVMSGLVLAAGVTAGVVIGRSNEQAGGPGTAAVTSEQAAEHSMSGADTRGGVAERTSIQAQLATSPVEATDSLATWLAVQQRLESKAQANVMGGMAERSQIQAHLAAQLQGQPTVAPQLPMPLCDMAPAQTIC